MFQRKIWNFFRSKIA